MPPPIAAWLGSYPTDLRGALDRAAQDQFRAVQASALAPELNPRDFGGSARRHLLAYLRQRALKLDGLAAGFPGAGLSDPAMSEERLERVRAALELCADLKVPSASATLRMSGEAETEFAKSTLPLLADWADRTRVHLSLHTGATNLHDAAREISRLGCPNLHLAYDTAAGTVAQLDPEIVAALGAVHVRDIVRRGELIQETEFGQGEVDFRDLLARLESGAYGGALVVRRDDPHAIDALRRGREYITSLFGRGGAR